MDELEDHHQLRHRRHLDVSPLLVGLLGVMAGAVVVATLHCLIVGWCNSNRQSQPRSPLISANTQRQHHLRGARETTSSSSNSSTASSSNSRLQLIVVASRYSKKESKEDTCAVCLSEFKEGDEVRVMPECAHVFHVPCIDMWLFSHLNCPLCRADFSSSSSSRRLTPAVHGSQNLVPET